MNFSRNKLLIMHIIILMLFSGISITMHAREFRHELNNSTTDTTSENLLANNNQSLVVKIPMNAEALSFVQQYALKQTKEYEKMKVWGKPYFDMYDNILTQYKIPTALKYLSVIESSLQPGTISWAGAVGPWQLMPYEGKRFGLMVNGGYDERMNFYKSTHAAAKLIKELYETFGDWLLVVAAYNGGVGRVKQAIKKSGSKSFWDLQYYLAEETRTHVKKYIGTHYIFEGGGGWTTMTAAETELYKAKVAATNALGINLTEEELATTTLIEVSGRYLGVVVSDFLLMDIDQFKKWNPGFDKKLAEGKKYQLRLSKERAFVFEAKKSEILLESIRTLLNGDNTASGG
jgi:membrane-bound lytic murein transglycosylase D